jgi:L-aminopeptidase/D-esterase-like protein
MIQNSITDIPGILVGQAQDDKALTGCTVVLCKNGAVGGVDQRGGAPGTRETDALRPMHLVNKIHAIVLAGGSAFGLDASTGVMRFLEEKRVGFDTGVVKVPIVASAVIFDLGVGNPKIRPDAVMGYQACLNAKPSRPLEGNYGAGIGATVGKILGMNYATKSGIGTASMEIGSGLVVGAITVVNAFGDVFDPEENQIIAGVQSPIQPKRGSTKKSHFPGTLSLMRSIVGRTSFKMATSQNTVIGVVATNAKLSKEEINKVAQMAQNGIAKTIQPAHTMLDGDTIFTLATGIKKADVSVIGAFAAEVVAKSIISAIKNAASINELLSYKELH